RGLSSDCLCFQIVSFWVRQRDFLKTTGARKFVNQLEETQRRRIAAIKARIGIRNNYSKRLTSLLLADNLNIYYVHIHRPLYGLKELVLDPCKEPNVCVLSIKWKLRFT